MKDVIIVSGGNIQRDFALDFLQKNKKENACLIAADKGVEFFVGTDWVPDVAVGDFDSLSSAGEKYLNTLKETEIVRLKPEKDDSDTQSAVNFAIDRGATVSYTHLDVYKRQLQGLPVQKQQKESCRQPVSQMCMYVQFPEV